MVQEGDVADVDRAKIARKHHQQTLEKNNAASTEVPSTDRRGNAAPSKAQNPSSSRAGARSATSRAEDGRTSGRRTATAVPVSKATPGSVRPGQAPAPAPQASLDRTPVSPTQSLKRYSSGEHSPPRRSKARPSYSASAAPDDLSRPKSTRTLWNPDTSQLNPSPRAGGPKGKAHQSNASTNKTARPASSSGNAPPQQPQDDARGTTASKNKDDAITIIKQPETRPISQEQLVAEVKGIYAGLVMVESKCIEVDNLQNTKEGAIPLNHEQWQALIALHRTLLHEHHDFFLASQHPSANTALRALAERYAMPARMWRHGIHSFLELLRHRLPDSLEHMLSFIYLAYSMMALLYETVPKFEDTWIECLGDLGRYRMAIEDDSMADREVWTAVSRHWYSKASDKSPTTGRLYHHLAILSRPNVLRQLFYYSKSLVVPTPFVSARESILTLFDPVLSDQSGKSSRLPELDMHFVCLHAVLFKGTEQERFQPAFDSFIGGLDIQIARCSRRWLEPGYYIGISNTCALLNYGDPSSTLLRAMEGEPSADYPMETPEDDNRFEKALQLNYRTHRVVWRRFGDPSILAYLHTTLVPIYHLIRSRNTIGRLEVSIPWKLLSVQLNTIIAASGNTIRFEDHEFPGPIKGESPRPLPEDFAMRGMIWTNTYFPSKWFSNDKIDDDEKYFEVASMTEERRIRILWIGCQIARHERWLQYDFETHQFAVSPEYDENIDELPAAAEQVAPAEDDEAMTEEQTATDEQDVTGKASDLMDVDEPTVSQP
ncbi:EST/SMG-like protein 2 like [Verticillium longisporum]|uniref:EST/SMG-like protein 2 like n=1 Tax=Verticillium longisporum TaxID=100787 RepID=A0A8I3AN64_VERLO|nr:EST/SMG-like protein 2 like [Verticillium longisporum]KAG7128257.1 EST/SMG-like protein 2 like [Verticillium longisporum]